jgi:NADPH-dependent curcumin reductase CurA
MRRRLPRAPCGPGVGMSNVNRQFLLAARPEGMIKESDFRYNEVPIPEPKDGEALVHVEYISLDPSMRGQMQSNVAYAPPLELGVVMRARGVGRVVTSRNANFPEGAMVSGALGMQEYAIGSDRVDRFRVFDDSLDPKVVLGILGGTGLTAYFGLLDVGEPKAGDMVVISGAAGATGSVAGQIAKIKGSTVVGMAGTDEKCAWLKELGFDGAINYRTQNIGDELDRLCPDGINVYFDNVGGEILDLCLDRLALNARVVICGGISRYNLEGEPPGPKNYFNLVFKRARMEGFLAGDYAPRFDEALAQMQTWVEEGRLKQRETVIEGFENLPKALIALFEGANTGKMMVKV